MISFLCLFACAELLASSSEFLPYSSKEELQVDIVKGWINLSCGTYYETTELPYAQKIASVDQQISAVSIQLNKQDDLGNLFSAISLERYNDIYTKQTGIEATKTGEVIDFPCDLVSTNFTPKDFLIEANDIFHRSALRYELSNDINNSPVDGWKLERDYLDIGFAESINAISGLISFKGNDQLIKALRYRFENSTNEDPNTQQEMMQASRATFQTQLAEFSDAAKEQFLNNKVLRSENLLTNLNGKTVSGDIYRYTDTLTKFGLAGLSEAKLFFYKNNVQDVDNPPRNNFPGSEDLDINRDGEKNSGKREDAAKRAKQVGNQLFYHSLPLIAGQSAIEFNDNIGYEVKRQIVDANQLYRDVKSGFNPNQLAGDFVPYQPVEHFLSQANSLVKRAMDSEDEAKRQARTAKMDATALSKELTNLKERYEDRIEALTGTTIEPEQVSSSIERAKFINRILNAESPRGDIGSQLLSKRNSELAADLINQEIQNILKRIEIEENRNKKTTRLILRNAQELTAITFAAEVARCCYTGTLSTFNPQAVIAATQEALVTRITQVQKAKIDDIESGAVIKNLMLEQLNQALAFKQAAVSIERQAVILANMVSELERTIANYARAIEDLGASYLSDPAYRIGATNAEQYANDAFEAATEASFVAAKALEYQWSEKYNNPVLKLDGGLASPLEKLFDPFSRAETVFSAQYARGASPSLQDYLGALKSWDVRMRQLRYPLQQSATVRFSMRDDILGYGAFSSDVAESRFQNFIQESRVKGSNLDNDDLEFKFNMDIVTERLFPNLPNIKIESIAINLVSDSSGSIRRTARSDAAIVDIVMLDRAFVRTFFANPPEQDDILSYELQEGRTIDKSPFLASVSATIDGYAAPIPVQNTQLENHSPAASIWMLRMKNNRFNNRDLSLEYLSDIQLQITYSYGQPRAIQFPY